MVNIIDYEGTPLLVSNKGQIFNEEGTELRQFTLFNRKTGYENKYLYVSFYDTQKGRSRRVQVSRLVCMAFHPIDNPEDFQVDHRDNNP